jgi:NAD(P)-dependent dehydrogenase (short-subunit alcohol dehydrogenase family)
LPEEMANAIFFLLTNTFVTGHVLDVDGGFVNMP